MRTQSALLGLGVAVVGIAVLMSWRTGAIEHFSPPLRLKANSALCFVLAGTALAIQWPRLRHPAWKWLGIACATVLMVVGVLTLFEHATGSNIGIDELLARDPQALGAPGRPAPVGAFSFLAIGIAFQLGARGSERALRAARMAAFVVLIPAVAGCLLYLYAGPVFVSQAALRVPLGSALVLVVLAGATLRIFVSEREIALQMSDGPGAVLRRRLLPTAVVVPVALGVLRIVSEKQGWYSDSLGLAFVVSVNMIVFIAVIELVARALFVQHEQRNALEQARQQTEARLDRLVEASVAGIVATDRDGKIVRVNQAFADLVGYTEAELRAPDFKLASLTPAAEKSRLERATGQLRKIGRAQPWEAEYIRKDGTRVPVLMTSSMSAESREVVWFVVDMAELRRVEQARRALEGELHAVIEAVREGILTADAVGKITFANAGAERVFAAPEPTLVGRSLGSLVHEQYRAEYEAHLTQLVDAGASRVIEIVGRRDNGDEFPLELSLSTWSTDGAIQFVAVARDTTERKRRDAELAEANRTKSQFLANMSHELRTPLNSIIGFTELMVREKVGPVSADHKEYLGDILTASKHLLVLINDILDLSKVEAGKIDLRPEPVHAQQMVAEVRDVVRGLAAEKSLKIEVTVDPRVDALVVDPSRVKQILYNYLSNAIKFTPERGVITVRITPDGDSMFRIDVEDTGVGISEQDIPKLFVEFRQLDSSHAKRHAGTGLGLALTKRIAEAAGGRVAVESTVGHGSTFSAVLPRKMNQT